MTTKKDDVLIKVEGLHKIYGDFHALNGIDEEIHRGEVVVIVGPSGSGKSTFLRSLNLLEVPDQGHIYFEGVDITDKHVDINKHRQKMGMTEKEKLGCQNICRETNGIYLFTAEDLEEYLK